MSYNKVYRCPICGDLVSVEAYVPLIQTADGGWVLDVDLDDEDAIEAIEQESIIAQCTNEHCGVVYLNGQELYTSDHNGNMVPVYENTLMEYFEHNVYSEYLDGLDEDEEPVALCDMFNNWVDSCIDYTPWRGTLGECSIDRFDGE